MAVVSLLISYHTADTESAVKPPQVSVRFIPCLAPQVLPPFGSQDHKMLWVGRDFKADLIPAPAAAGPGCRINAGISVGFSSELSLGWFYGTASPVSTFGDLYSPLV